MAYWAIELTPDLSAAEFERATTGGANETMEQEAPTGELLHTAGFAIAEERDVTDGYLEVVQRWLAAAERLEAPLRERLGDEVYEERLGVRRHGFEVSSDGLHRRMFYVADPI